MSEILKVCSVCIKEKPKLTRGYCSTCYSRYYKSKEFEKIKIISPPNILTQEQKDCLISLLLGDGCLYYNNSYTAPILCVARCTIDAEYLEYQYQIFKDFCSSPVKYSNVFDKRTGKSYSKCKFATRQAKIFSEYRNKWYPDGTKIIPKDLELNPIICALWFCDDGSIGSYRDNRLRLKIATHGFPNSDTEWMADYLTTTLNARFSVGHDHDHAFIIGNDDAAKAFINYIKDYIPQSMSRKITWTHEQFLLPRSRPIAKNRLKHDLNYREIQILSALSGGIDKSSLEICKEINWLSGKDQKAPSSYNRYLQKFLKEKWIEPKIYLVGKKRTKYLLTSQGEEILIKALDFNKSLNF